MSNPIPLKQLQALHALIEAGGGAGWVRPQAIGGGRHTHHSQTLRALNQKGLVVRAPRATPAAFRLGAKSRYEYRPTAAGVELSERIRPA